MTRNFHSLRDRLIYRSFCSYMNALEIEIKFLQLITRQYYEVVPEKYRTFCVFNARLLQMVLTHYRIASELMPCQIWLSRPDDSIALGFLDTKPGPGGWDGHVACRAGDYFIDASVHHFQESTGLPYPILLSSCSITLLACRCRNILASR